MLLLHAALRRLNVAPRRQPVTRGSRADVRAPGRRVVSFACCVRGRARAGRPRGWLCACSRYLSVM
eukprot:9117840-Pyramimonas_sp.AAC.1